MPIQWKLYLADIWYNPLRKLWGQTWEAGSCFVGEAISIFCWRKSTNCNINQLMMQFSTFPCSCKTNQTCNTIDVTSAQNINRRTHPRCLLFLFIKLAQGSTGMWKIIFQNSNTKFFGKGLFQGKESSQNTIKKGDKKFCEWILWACGFHIYICYCKQSVMFQTPLLLCPGPINIYKNINIYIYICLADPGELRMGSGTL